MIKIFSILALFCFVGTLHAREQRETRYYKEIGATISLPHHFEGLWPLLNLPPKEDHYRFEYQSLRPIEITFHDAAGGFKNSADGWAKARFQYDREGKLIETSFLDKDEKPILSRSLRFSKETITYDLDGKPQQTFYNHKGKILKTPQKDWKNSF